MKTQTYLLLLISIIQSSLFSQTSYIDSTFGTNGYTYTDIDSGSTDFVSNSFLQADGKVVLVGGTETGTGGTPNVTLTRYKVDGTLDSSFGSNGIVNTSLKYHYGMISNATFSVGIEQQSNGKILVGSDVLARFHQNGSVDTTFIRSANWREFINDLKILPGGKILAFGTKTTCLPWPSGCGNQAIIRRFHSNGQRDTSFSNNGILSTNISGVTVDVQKQSANEYLVLQNYTWGGGLGGFVYHSLFRIDTNGNVDTSFKSSVSMDGDAYAVEVLSTGKIITASFSNNGKEGYLIKSYNSNGDIDSTFGKNGTLGIGKAEWMNERVGIKILKDDRIVFTGVQRTGYGTKSGQIITGIISPNGALDTICSPSYVYGSGTATTLQIQDDGKIVVGGWDSTSNSLDFMITRFNPFWVKSGQLKDSVCPGFIFNNKTYFESGVYFDTIASIHGCDSVISLNLTIWTTNTSVVQNDRILAANAQNASYQWIDCSTGNVISGDTNRTFTAAQNGNYAVVVTQNGCSDTSACFEITTVGFQDIEHTNVSIYPNPSNGQFTIDFGKEISNGMVTILNLQGQPIYEQPLKNQYMHRMELNEPRGFYILRTSIGNEITTQKIIIE